MHALFLTCTHAWITFIHVFVGTNGVGNRFPIFYLTAESFLRPRVRSRRGFDQTTKAKANSGNVDYFRIYIHKLLHSSSLSIALFLSHCNFAVVRYLALQLIFCATLSGKDSQNEWLWSNEAIGVSRCNDNLFMHACCFFGRKIVCATEYQAPVKAE